MRSETLYQSLLIVLGVITTLFLGVFFWREMAPEYRLYQDAYVALEEFRSTYTGEPPSPFSVGIKQILLPRKDKAPEVVDRCISCHLATKFEHFSPTMIAKDINGNSLYDANGVPIKVPNPNYVWGHLNAKVSELTDAKVNEQLTQQGNQSEVEKRLAEAKALSALKTTKVGDATYDMTKVLAAHPLIGRETRPFEFHPVDEYGCTSCHNGNGNGLVTDKAHGPVIDGYYEAEEEGHKPTFLESDPLNDPSFSKVFNGKPGHKLLFQTTPLYVGKLIQAKCVQCHQPTDMTLNTAASNVERLISQKKKVNTQTSKAYSSDVQSVIDLLANRREIQSKGFETVLKELDQKSHDYTLPLKNQNDAESQLAYLLKVVGDRTKIDPQQAEQKAIDRINQELVTFLGSLTVADQLQDTLITESANPEEALRQFVTNQRQKGQTKGLLFAKAEALDLEDALLQHIKDVQNPITSAISNQNAITALTSDIDSLTDSYQRGRELFLSQACYACHRIAGYSRGGVGPELTQEGMSYPWFVKESIVWPQADLKTSTMPNMRLDHEEVEDLMTYMLAQRTDNKVVSDIAHKTAIKEWEEGKKLPWEKPLSSAQVQNVRESMVIFATEGCAGCHRLKGYDSNTDYTINKGTPSFEERYDVQLWFTQLFPEDLLGSQIVKAIEENRKAINQNISENVREGSILEEIEKRFPGEIAALYPNFKFASRAKNHFYSEKIAKAKDSEEAHALQKEWNEWKQAVHDVLMVYVQEYGLGRLIGPRPNWSGIYRSDEWLMEHFWSPSLHVPRSIMPVFPFDNTKFRALVHMLDVLGIRNRDSVREIWKERGFSPELAYQIHCSQCHGEYELGNGPVSAWIYPLPKNLRNAAFLESLTKKEAIKSIQHGVNGTPMPPWGEIGAGKQLKNPVPILTHDEIVQLVEWLYQAIPNQIHDKKPATVPKWEYTPEDVIKELQKAGHKLSYSDMFPNGAGFIASQEPTTDTRLNSELTVDQLFDHIPNTAESDYDHYYIKRQYYTPDNLKSGELFFNLNCAVCHGKEADGSGSRAGIMQDAKPRMLTNLDWIQSRDDMRLLRSIKYGVPGTAMTPWGDLTTSLQRLQLVMYIRSLSETQMIREQLQEALYDTYERPITMIIAVLSKSDIKILDLQEKLASLEKQQKNLINQIREGAQSPDALKQLFAKEKELKQELANYQQQQSHLNQLIQSLKQEQEENRTAGLTLIGSEEAKGLMKNYLSLITFGKDRLQNQKDQLVFTTVSNADIRSKLNQIVNEIDQKIALLKDKKRTFNDDSADDQSAIYDINQKIKSLERIKASIITSTNETLRLQVKQQAIYNELYPQSHKDNQ